MTTKMSSEAVEIRALVFSAMLEAGSTPADIEAMMAESLKDVNIFCEVAAYLFTAQEAEAGN